MDAYSLAIAENVNDHRSDGFKCRRAKALMPFILTRLMFSNVMRRAMEPPCRSIITLFLSLLRAEWLVAEKTDALVEDFLLKNTDVVVYGGQRSPQRTIRVCILLDGEGRHYRREIMTIMYKHKIENTE